MATADQIKALLKSYSEGDGPRFLSIAMQIASHEARTGKGRLAIELRKLVDEIKGKQAAGKIGGVIPIARPSGELADLLCVSYPSTLLSEMVLSETVQITLKRVLEEYKKRSRLRAHGLSPRRKLLLVGPPGCGKTMSARALAGETKLPLCSIQLHSLITKFMGETAVKLHSVFNSMLKVRGVYLFDEFDAIGGHRASSNDVGEIRRVLNSFLQFLEADESESIIVGATNHIDLLDRALFRRFDDVIEYHLPEPEEVVELIKNRLSAFKLVRVDWGKIGKSAEQLSHADITQACDNTAKDVVLSGKKSINGQSILNAIKSKSRPVLRK